MNMKKWLLTGTLISMLGAFSACSEDPSSPDQPESSSDVLSSGGDTPTSSSDGTSATTPGSSTGTSSAAVPVSSSIADTDEPQMGCSEIMYNAAEGSELEWVEIFIAGGKDMDNMAEYQMHLSGAVDYVFPAEALKKGEYVVVTNNTALFKAAYPSFAGRLFGPWTGKLINEGDVVNVKIRGEGDVTCAFSNEPPWPSLADGKGRTLVYKGGNAAQPNSWAASKVNGGNPGVGNDEWITPASVRINEIMPNIGADPAWIELYNTGSEEVDVAGWTLEVKRRNQTLTIKSGAVSTKIPAKGFVVLDAVDNFDAELVVTPEGGEFYLRGSLEGEESSIWVPSYTGTSGVVDLSDGSTAQGPLTAATPGTANGTLRVGDVYINEIYYNPSMTGSVRFEFMEIVNATDKDITMYSGTAQKGWKIEGINIEFSAGTVLPAKAMMLLVSDTMVADTGWIRSNFSIDPAVKFGIYKGKLSNRGETIAVKEPYKREEDSSNPANVKYFYIWHDATLYSDNWPALKEADGAGYSLHRVDLTTMGYEASAWKAAEPTPGK